jgi:hypothetical protein
VARIAPSARRRQTAALATREDVDVNADDLRALQAPLKERYRAEPGVTLKAVATAMGVTLRSGRVTAEGDLDFRGTLGVAKEAPVGFTDIRLTFDFSTDAPEAQLDSLLKLTERYCVVLQTLKRSPTIEARITRV